MLHVRWHSVSRVFNFIQSVARVKSVTINAFLSIQYRHLTDGQTGIIGKTILRALHALHADAR